MDQDDKIEGPVRFKPLKFLKCLSAGHKFQTSHAYPNTMTCTRCRLRVKG